MEMYRTIYRIYERMAGTAFAMAFPALFILLSFPVSVSAQGSLDDTRYNQFTVMHTGTGSLDDPWYNFHNNYVSTAYETNLSNFRATFKTWLMLEEPKVEMIDSALSKRAVEEAINIAEHKLDLAWLAEKDRVGKALSRYNDRISHIGDYNGTTQAFNYYDLNAKRFESEIKVVQDSYQPNSFKKREYTNIYKSILDADASLCRYLEYCRARDHSEVPDTTVYKKLQTTNIANTARQRWIQAFKQANPK